MFGEFDSESPRVPSPWDSLTPPSVSPPTRPQGIPKLVPEADEGNVEYKLQLLSPTPARFARLVTQLKWRLLEGGGQAYYELGVADSGTLVGLPRQQLEESLETLEMMAGEIGASVIVVKEIEVPPELSSIAESQLEKWESRKSTRRKDLLRMIKHDASPVMSATELESELSTIDFTDVDESTCYSPTTSASVEVEADVVQLRPSTTPFDPDLAMFTMDIADDVADYADNEGPDDDAANECVAEFSISLEVSSVYKPRPMRQRVAHITPPLSTHFAHARKKLKNGYPPSQSTDAVDTGDSVAQNSTEVSSQSNGAKGRSRRDKRDKRRESRHNSLLIHVPTRRLNETLPNHVPQHAIPPSPTNALDSSALEPVHVIVDPPPDDSSGTTTTASKEPRLIVEALVVRKLSLDEAFLDFEGFSLQ